MILETKTRKDWEKQLLEIISDSGDSGDSGDMWYKDEYLRIVAQRTEKTETVMTLVEYLASIIGDTYANSCLVEYIISKVLSYENTEAGNELFRKVLNIPK